MAVYVGRQPIYDRNLGVYGYELLYRGGESNAASFTDGSQATARVVANSFIELGIDRVTHGKPAFLNFTREIIVGEMVQLLPQELVVIEVLEDVEIDEEVIESLRGLRRAGYRIALDDFLYRDELATLVALADIVKLDVMGMSRDDLTEHAELLRGHGAELLAEKVETREDYDFCRKLGFTYFQGYLLSRPQILTARRPPATGLGVLDLLARVHDDTLTLEELEGIISKDVGLSYKLLRYINSAAFALPVKVASIRHALLLLGKRMVRVWASLVVLAAFSGRTEELATTAMVRAKMCENLGCRDAEERAESYFIVGLFSTLEILMGMPMADILEKLPLSDDIAAALIDREGAMGAALDCVLSYERGRWDEVDKSRFRGEDVCAAYLDALEWTDKVLGVDHDDEADPAAGRTDGDTEKES